MSLDEFLEGRRKAAFSWGAHDCCTFAADWVQHRTGCDPMADLRGLTTAMAAMRRLRAAGGFLGAGDARLGPRVPRLMAARGDVVLIPAGRPGRASGFTFGVHTGSHLAAPGLDGLVFLPVSIAEAAWRVA